MKIFSRPLLFAPLFIFALSPQLLAAKTDPMLQMRSFVQQTCARMPFWKSSLRLPNFGFTSFVVDVGSLVWSCLGGFRLSYAGPAAFEFASTGSEAWIGRPTLRDPKAKIEHHWRMDGHELQSVLAYLKGDDSRLATLRSRFVIEVVKDPAATQAGLWAVSLKPIKPEDFSALRLDWHIKTGELRSVLWVSLQGLPLQLDLSPPVALARGSVETLIAPKIPAGAKVEKVPPLKKTK